MVAKHILNDSQKPVNWDDGKIWFCYSKQRNERDGNGHSKPDLNISLQTSHWMTVYDELSRNREANEKKISSHALAEAFYYSSCICSSSLSVCENIAYIFGTCWHPMTAQQQYIYFRGKHCSLNPTWSELLKSRITLSSFSSLLLLLSVSSSNNGSNLRLKWI